MSVCSSQRAYDGTWAWVSRARLRTSYMKSETHSSARVAPKGCMALSGGLSLQQPLQVLGRAGDAGILRRLLQRGRWDRVGRLPLAAAAVPPGRARAAGTTRWCPVRGSPTMIQGLSMRSSRTSGCSTDHRCSAMRFERADASIFETRIRPKVVSSASSSHERRNTSSGSRKESPPKSSDPAILVADFTIEEGRSDGRSSPKRSSPLPTQLRARSGRLRNSESCHVYSTSLTPTRPPRCLRGRPRPPCAPPTDGLRGRRGRGPPPPW